MTVLHHHRRGLPHHRTCHSLGHGGWWVTSLVLLGLLALSVSGFTIPTIVSSTSHCHSTGTTLTTPTATTTTTICLGASAKDGNEEDILNPLLSLIKPSKTVEVFSLVQQLRSEGMDIVSLCVGEPDYAPPPSVLETTSHALHKGEYTRYTAVNGLLELRQAIAKDYQRRKSLTYDPQTQIIVSNGAKQCVWQTILALAGKDDVVLIPAPHWPYPDMTALTSATPIMIPTKAEQGYLLQPHELRQALQDHPTTKLLILCNPSNPTGGVYTIEQLQELVTVLQDYPQVHILSDEIYERLVYTNDDNVEIEDDFTYVDTCPSIATLSPDMYRRTIVINGLSKSHAMTGFRIGYLLAGNPAIAKAVSKIQSQITSCASSVSQYAAITALTKVSDAELELNYQVMRSKRDYVLQRLSEMPHVTVQVPPQGAFYVLPDISYYCSDAKEEDADNFDDVALCVELLYQVGLALVPGSAFGAPGTVRISYATSMEELTLAMQKLQDYLQSKL